MDAAVKAVVAVDMGGTRIKAARVHLGAGDDSSSAPQVVDQRTVDAPSSLAPALGVLAPLLSDLGAGAIGVGLAVPGLVRADGIIQALPGKYDGIVGFDLPSWLSAQTGVASVVVNDAIGYGVGEAVWGAGRGAQRVLVMTIGTGVGVAVIEDGEPVSSGPLGGGITGGNVLISEEDGGYLDTAGRSGTLEARCRADRIVDYARASGADVADVPGVYALAAAGDPAARAGIAHYRDWLARGVAALAVAHGADRVVIGGGPAVAAAPWMDGLAEQVRPRLWPSHELTIALSALGDSAAAVGLAHLVSRRASALS